jgi:hypothetical protein
MSAAQQGDALISRPGPPTHDDFETDADGDEIPDGWYNLRDASYQPIGGADGPRCLMFENQRPGRPARASRAFGIDGRKHEAVIIGVWVRCREVSGGERLGEDASLMIDFLDEHLNAAGRGLLGPWLSSKQSDDNWFHVAKRLNVPASTRDAIMSVGLLGGTGTLWIDGLTIELVPVGGAQTTNLVLNGDVELGAYEPDGWVTLAGARRVSPGFESAAAIELSRSGAQAQLPLSGPLSGVTELSISCQARGSALRSSGGAQCGLYFLDEAGRVLAGSAGSTRLFRFAGTFGWRSHQATARLPAGAKRAVVQFEKLDATGTVWVDNLVVMASPAPDRSRWLPYHTRTDTAGWHAFEPALEIVVGSALDASALLEPRAKPARPVTIRNGRLHYGDAGRARFFGVNLLPPLATLEAPRAEALADKLVGLGVNLVRFDDLDTPLGPGRSLIDDSAEDTSTLDPEMLARFDHLVALLKQRGIAISLSLNESRRFRTGDNATAATSLPPGGGPAAAFDPKIADVIKRFAENLLGHVNPETGLSLRDDPVLAWIAISGERSLFNMIEEPGALPSESALLLAEFGKRQAVALGRPLWQRVEAAQWQSIAEGLHSWGVGVPIAGCAHWRGEQEFLAAQLAHGLDLLDDRLYLNAQPFAFGDRRGLIWDRTGGIIHAAVRKRRSDRPYVVSQWCERTDGLWALGQEGAGLLLAADQAAAEDWDALVRRGVFFQPEVWGAAAPGTQGGADLFAIPEVLNANPAVFSLLPHAASVFHRVKSQRSTEQTTSPRAAIWEPATGRVVIDTPHTQALVANLDRRPARFDALLIESVTPASCVAVSSLGTEPIAHAKRLLVTAVARIEPTGMTYADTYRTAPGNSGRPPLLCEPVKAAVSWKSTDANIKAYALDNSGRRLREVPLARTKEGATLELDGAHPGLHWELVSE